MIDEILHKDNFESKDINSYKLDQKRAENACSHHFVKWGNLRSWWSVLLVEETGMAGENHRPAASH
jgi:hypothetical protein